MNSISSRPLAAAIAASACPRAVPSHSALRLKPRSKRKEVGEAVESRRRRRSRFDLRRRDPVAALSTSSSSSSLARAASSAHARSLYPEVVRDPFASLLAEAAGLKPEEVREEESDDDRPPPSAFAAVAAAFADSALLSATGLVNFETGDSKGREYRQIVVLGPGLDTRAQRIDWPAGTVIFECASADAHAVAAAALASQRAREAFDDAAAADSTAESASESDGASPSSATPPLPSSFNGSGAPRGRLLRRVVCDASTAEGREGLAGALYDSGFRAERLSAWCVNAGALFEGREPPTSDLRELFGAVASCAAFCSFVVGDLPALTRSEAEDAVACSGILGSVLEFGSSDDVAGSELWERKGWNGGREKERDGDERRRRLFIGQQRTRSDAELGILAEFSRAAEEAEGFEDNIS